MSTSKPFLRWAQRHRWLVRRLPDRLVVWLAWREIRRDPEFMAYLAQLSRERRAEPRLPEPDPGLVSKATINHGSRR